MSVYGAMNAAVSGMRAQSKSLGNISDNIANSQTVGFKRVDTSFAELVTLSNRRTHSPGGVIATPRYRHAVQGEISQTQITTNMGISGNGFFLVSKPNSITPGGVSFDNEQLFTRRGDFEVDKFGYMRNGGGYYLNGRMVLDEDTLNTSDLNTPIRIETDVMQARMTSRVNYNANLPSGAAAFPSSVQTTVGTRQAQADTIDFTPTLPYNPVTDAVSVDVNGTTYTVAAGTAGIVTIADALDNLAGQIQAAHPTFTIRTPNSGAGANTLEIRGSTTVPTFTVANPVPAAATLATVASHQRASFAGSLTAPINVGDRISITINNVEYSRTFSAGDVDLDTFLTNFADQIDGAGGTVIGPGETVNGVTAAAGELVIVGAATINRNPAISGGAAYALNLANTDEQALYAAAGSYSGGAVTLFNDLGTPADIQMRWVNTGANNEWTLLAKDPNGGTEPWQNLGTFTFTEGRPTLHNGAAFAGTVNIAAGTLTGFNEDVTLDFTGIDNNPNDGLPNILLTQYYADDIAVYRLDQDGYMAGILTDVFINDFGFVVANYDNGRSRTLYQVPLATFASPADLGRLDGGAFERTPESGDPLIARSGQAGAGDIVASAIEQSNVDIADEFTKMIVTQRAYSANSKTVRTADEMLEEVVNLKR